MLRLLLLGAWLVRGSALRPTTGPRASLAAGNWVKFICGASNQDLPLIRNLCLVYTLAGVDCIDLSADPAVVSAAHEGVARALELSLLPDEAAARPKPLLMVSVNDNEDLHFRKASFDPSKCPSDCPRPCERVCPAWAIPPLANLQQASATAAAAVVATATSASSEGVVTERCYGCGRCIPTCPLGLIQGVSYVANRTAIAHLFQSGRVDAVEIHTQHGQTAAFAELWQQVGQSVLENAQIIAVSFPDMADATVPYITKLNDIISDHPDWPKFKGAQIWQTDGRPMSGDIGKGTAHSAITFGIKMLEEMHEAKTISGINLESTRHFVQIAGGTNDYSVTLGESLGIQSKTGFGGFAFGGYARREIGDVLRKLEDARPGTRLEDHRDELEVCLAFATKLVESVKKKK